MRSPAVPLCLVLLAGCATPRPHTELPRAPTKEAPYDERARYLRAHSSDGVEWGQQGFWQLHGGDRVYWPEDLLPAVDDDSPTAVNLRTHVENRERTETLTTWVTTPVMLSVLASTVGLGVGFSLAANETRGDFGGTFVHPWFLGTAGWFTASMAAMGVAFWLEAEPSRIARETLHTAIVTYPQSLEDRLGLHVDGDGNIVDTTRAKVLGPANALGGLKGEGAIFGVGGLGTREPPAETLEPASDDEPPPPLPTDDPADD